MKKVVAWLLLFSALRLNAQVDAYQHQLQLVDSVRNYIQNILHLNIGNDFYTKWSTHKDSMYYYLYVSNAYQVESILPNTYQVYNIEDSAIATADKYSRQGYHTLVYRTAGTSTAELTPKLLSYPDEAIAFIMVHEAVHRHISFMQLKPGYPYVFEECLCDAMANKACIAMAKDLNLFYLKSASGQKRIFEQVYAYINRKQKSLQASDTTAKAQIFVQATSRIKTIVKNGNQFQKDRMIYPVNNAYFLRNNSYTTHYFELLKMLNNHLLISDVINKIYKREVLQKDEKR